MPYFRKKPVTIEAFQVGLTPQPVPTWLCVPQVTWCMPYPLPVGYTGQVCIIETLEGDMIAQAGDWIIKGVLGELYPCKPDIFDATYEKVEPNLYVEGE